MEKEEIVADGIDEVVKSKRNKFLKSLESNMYFKSVFSGDSLSFEWIDQIEFSCPYLDIVVRNPKLTLIKEERVVNVEKSKKVTVESIKDLSKHTNYISKYDGDKIKLNTFLYIDASLALGVGIATDNVEEGNLIKEIDCIYI